jgi:hypothetical protein
LSSQGQFPRLYVRELASFEAAKAFTRVRRKASGSARMKLEGALGNREA